LWSTCKQIEVTSTLTYSCSVDPTVDSTRIEHARVELSYDGMNFFHALLDDATITLVAAPELDLESDNAIASTGGAIRFLVRNAATIDDVAAVKVFVGGQACVL